MKLFNFVALLGLAVPLSSAAAGGHHARGHRSRHTDIARRAEGDLELWKRTSNSRWTFYDVGLGACGKHNAPGDFIVALNSAQFGGGYPGPNCFKTITMQYNGKTTTAQIMDECPGCPYGGLDLSKGLFGFFDSLDKGVLTGNWWFAGDGPAPAPKPAPPKPAPPPPPHTTKKPAPPPPPPTPTFHSPKTTPKPTPTTTEAPEKPATHEESSTKASSSSKAPSASASASVNHSSGVAGGLAAPAATGSVQDGNLNSIDQALIGLGGVVVAGAQAD